MYQVICALLAKKYMSCLVCNGKVRNLVVKLVWTITIGYEMILQCIFRWWKCLSCHLSYIDLSGTNLCLSNLTLAGIELYSIYWLVGVGTIVMRCNIDYELCSCDISKLRALGNGPLGSIFIYPSDANVMEEECVFGSEVMKECY